ncbi:UBC-like protein [Linderina pennispora]|uniref:UBC-like protein n=1 Tax=Linderina pennispora TaxID=61395 RepID=A0A1Y1VX66_9FUNG|nr:UBC-like protein [Linderina pennispora]ORX65334.1 UBC-like protein [Linderina pennispora]
MAGCLRAEQLMKELAGLTASPSSHASVYNASQPDRWLLKLHAAGHTPYAGDEFTLLFKVPDNYPVEAPEVMLFGNVPVHPYVCTNGHICLSIRYQH